KQSATEIAVKRRVFVLEVGDEYVGKAVAVVITDFNSHAPFSLTQLANRDTGGHRDFGKAELRAPQVKVLGRFVTGDIEIDPAVAVQIGRDDAQTPYVPREPHPVRPVFEPPVPRVMKKAARGAGV